MPGNNKMPSLLLKRWPGGDKPGKGGFGGDYETLDRQPGLPGGRGLSVRGGDGDAE